MVGVLGRFSVSLRTYVAPLDDVERDMCPGRLGVNTHAWHSHWCTCLVELYALVRFRSHMSGNVRRANYTTIHACRAVFRCIGFSERAIWFATDLHPIALRCLPSEKTKGTLFSNLPQGPASSLGPGKSLRYRSRIISYLSSLKPLTDPVWGKTDQKSYRVPRSEATLSTFSRHVDPPTTI